MPKPLSPEPLTRFDGFLFAADVDFLKRTLGAGWSVKVREVVREFVVKAPRKRTIGDIDER